MECLPSHQKLHPLPAADFPQTRNILRLLRIHFHCDMTPSNAMLPLVITATTATYLPHWGRGKMAAIFQTTSSNAFSWMKVYEFRSRFHWSLFLRAQLILFQHWFRWWLGAGQATSHYLNQCGSVYWRIYASLGFNELNDNTSPFYTPTSSK